MADAVFARARACFSEDGRVELTLAAAWENTVARYDHAVGVESMGRWHPQPR